MQVEKLILDNERAFWDGIELEVAEIPESTKKAICLGMDHGEDIWTPKSVTCLVKLKNGRYRAYVPQFVMEGHA